MIYLQIILKTILRSAQSLLQAVKEPLCPATAVIDASRDSFYSPADSDTCPEFTFSFDEEIEFNCAVFSEVIELGQKIRGFELSADVDGERKLLASGSCVGNKCAKRFEKVRSSRVYFKITSSVSAPLINFFGIYSVAEKDSNDGKIGFVGRDLAKSSSTIIEKRADSEELFIQLGGIRSFNLLKLVGKGIESFQVYIFNGSSFEYFGEGKGSDRETIFDFGKVIDWSYRLKIKLSLGEGAEIECVTPKLYYAEE